jgi:hypothetical protein
MRALLLLALLALGVPSRPAPRPARHDIVDPYGAGPIARPIVARR